MLIPRDLVELFRRYRLVYPVRNGQVNNADRMMVRDPHVRIAHDGISHRLPTPN